VLRASAPCPKSVTAADSQSCSNEGECVDQAAAIRRFKGLASVIADLNGTIKELFVSGEDTIIVRGEATGTPIKTFVGQSRPGEVSGSCRLVTHSRIRRSYHVENWTAALRQRQRLTTSVNRRRSDHQSERRSSAALLTGGISETLDPCYAGKFAFGVHRESCSAIDASSTIAHFDPDELHWQVEKLLSVRSRRQSDSAEAPVFVAQIIYCLAVRQRLDFDEFSNQSLFCD
jgi:hypothetical protein